MTALFLVQKFVEIFRIFITIQCNLDLVTLNLVTACDLVPIFLRPFFNLIHKIIQFSDSFFGGPKSVTKSGLHCICIMNPTHSTVDMKGDVKQS